MVSEAGSVATMATAGDGGDAAMEDLCTMSELGADERQSYDMQKLIMEKSLAKLLKPWTYVRYSEGGKQCFEPVTVARLKELHANVHFWEPRMCEVDGEQVQMGYAKRSFIPRWIQDEKILTFSRVVVDPACTDPTALNLWPGFLAEETPAEHRVPDADVAAFVQPILAHVRALLGSDEYAAFFLQFMAHLVQRPVKKTELAIVLSGAQGCGKNTIVDFFAKNVLGPKLSVESSRVASLLPEHGHSTMLLNRTLCVVNEANFASVSTHMDDLKQAITAPTLNFNPAYTADNNVNFVFTTNHHHALPVSNDNRRLVPFQCSAGLVGNYPYFTTLHAFLAGPKAAWAFLQYLRLHITLPETLSHTMPTTEYCRDLQYAGIPWIAKFLTVQCIWSGEPELVCKVQKYMSGRGVRSTEWAEDYRRWVVEVHPEIGRTCNTGRYGKQVYALLGLSEAQLAAGANGSLSNTTGVSRSRAGGPSRYAVNFALLEAFLRSKKLYDAHLEL